MNSKEPERTTEILLNYRGSITKLLSSLFDNLKFEVLEQRVDRAGIFARKLGVREDDEVCFRRSAFSLPHSSQTQPLSASVPHRVVCLAYTIFPIKVLESISHSFVREVLKGNRPIGEIIEEFELKVKREKLWSITTTDVKTVLNTLQEYKPILIDYNTVSNYLIMNSRIVESEKTIFDLLEIFDLQELAKGRAAP